MKVNDARKQLGAKAKLTNTKASGKFGCTTCKKHVCEKHWKDHGKNQQLVNVYLVVTNVGLVQIATYCDILRRCGSKS